MACSIYEWVHFDEVHYKIYKIFVTIIQHLPKCFLHA